MVRPNTVIAPLLFGIGVSLSHMYGSKLLLTLLSRLGMSVSYDEVTRFKQSVIQSPHDNLPKTYPNCFTQFAADNVDHNVCTLDGLGTFHGMGIISMSTPGAEAETISSGQQMPIPRLAREKQLNITQNRNVKLLHYAIPEQPPTSIVSFLPWLELQTPFVLPADFAMDMLWHCSWFFCRNDGSSDALRPSWAAFMHENCGCDDNALVAPAFIKMYPILDKNPNDYSAIYSTWLELYY